jgi:RND family efflux transporter MFP subunit
MHTGWTVRLISVAWRPLLGLAGLVLLVLYATGAWREKTVPGVVAAPPGLPVPADAALVTVVSEAVAPRLELVGTAASEEAIHLSARISGYVQSVTVTAGSRVRKGQLLVTLDDREVREQLAEAEAQLKQAEIEYGRTRQLFDAKAATEQALVAAELLQSTARAQIERVRVLLSYARVTAPIDGIVTDRRIEVGDLASPGQLLLAVYDSCRMRLEVPVPDRLVDKLALEQTVEVRLERPARTFSGTVTEIVSEVDPASRTQTVKIRLESACGDILPGSFGRLLLEGEARPGILVPAGAVYRVGQCEYVQVAQGERALRRLVRTGPAHADRVEILAGVEPGDRLLLNPVREAR